MACNSSDCYDCINKESIEDDEGLSLKILSAYVDHLAERIQALDKWCIEHEAEGQAYGAQYESEMAELKNKMEKVRDGQKPFRGAVIVNDPKPSSTIINSISELVKAVSDGGALILSNQLECIGKRITDIPAHSKADFYWEFKDGSKGRYIHPRISGDKYSSKAVWEVIN